MAKKLIGWSPDPLKDILEAQDVNACRVNACSKSWRSGYCRQTKRCARAIPDGTAARDRFIGKELGKAPAKLTVRETDFAVEYIERKEFKRCRPVVIEVTNKGRR